MEAIMQSQSTDTPSFATNPKEALQHFNELGFHIEYGVLNDIECQRYIHASQTLENALNGSFRPQMMPNRQNPIYLEAMQNRTITNIMNLLVDGKAMGLQTEYFYCQPGTRGFSLNQDNFFVQASVGAFASAWVALTDTHTQKGGLIVYPRSHKEGLLPVRKLDIGPAASQDPNANNEESIVPTQYKPINATVPKGAVLFIHGHVVHGSNPNTSNEWRHVLLNTYIREGESYRPGNYAQREAIEL